MTTDKIPFLIYGAYGYTGELIARLAIKKGYRPMLGGREENKLKLLAEELRLPYIVCNLQEEEKLDKALKTVKGVINCAGPFSKTAKLMLYACLRNKVHYLDITGEIEVFEWIATKDKEAKKAGIVLLPGVGFDVTPTDCLAAYLKNKLPDAHRLTLAFAGVQHMSKGTALTMLENVHNGGMIREGGILRKVPAGFQTKQVNFGNWKQTVVSIPWGDVSTAFYSTGIPNIIVYTAVSVSRLTLIKASRYMGWLLKSNPVQAYLKNKVNQTITGPNDQQRERAQTYIWGQVSNPAGQTFTARLQTPEAYALTTYTALAAAEIVTDGKIPAGFHTPSMAFGADFILQIAGVIREDV